MGVSYFQRAERVECVESESPGSDDRGGIGTVQSVQQIHRDHHWQIVLLSRRIVFSKVGDASDVSAFSDSISKHFIENLNIAPAEIDSLT